MKGNFEDLFNPDGSLSNKMGPILRDCKEEPWVKRIYATFGKTTVQKIYNVKNNITEQPKCNHCGQPLSFKNWNEGYRKVCPNCERRGLKIENEVVTNPDTYSDVEDGKPKVISQEKDFEHNKVESSIITTLGSNAKESDLLKEHGLDPNLWKIVKIKHSIWQQNSKKDGLKDLYASKIEAEPRTLVDLNEEQLTKKLNEIIKFKPIPLPTIKRDSNNTVIIPIADLHFGLLAAESTTGNKYNMAIAEARVDYFLKMLKNEFNKRNWFKVSNVIITLGNDFFNADNLVGTTTRGTPQDQECNYFDIFDRGVKLAVKIIETVKDMLPHTERIDVCNVQSNHDKVTSNALVQCLYYKYQNDSKIKIHPETGKKPRFYLKAGNNLFGFSHETKIQDCARLMSSEASEDWSVCRYKTFFIAHLHHEEVAEYGPVVVRRLPILSGMSNWTNDMGFVGNIPRSQVFIFDNTRGLTDVVNINIPESLTE